MSNQHQSTKTISEDPSTLNAKILNAESRSVLIAIPVGLLSGLIAYWMSSTFSIINTLVIGVGAFAMTATLLFHFHFGKNLPKRVISPEEYGSPLTFHKPSSGENIAIQAYNRANGNPSSNFILPSKYI